MEKTHSPRKKLKHRLPKKIIGCSEWVRLPMLHIPAMKAKVDTGARTSALHALDPEPFRKAGETWIRFGVIPDTARPHARRLCSAPIADRRMVTNSGGHREHRYFIHTLIELGGETWEAEVSLTDRATMKFDLLIGRTALRGHFLVDPGRSYLAGRPREKTGWRPAPLHLSHTHKEKRH
ncbi:MAG: RimK/LysX family protein [bacterium]|nr:RimK/LysX family protein [bacterium]